jgi:hypothetical protein
MEETPTQQLHPRFEKDKRRAVSLSVDPMNGETFDALEEKDIEEPQSPTPKGGFRSKFKTFSQSFGRVVPFGKQSPTSLPADETSEPHSPKQTEEPKPIKETPEEEYERYVEEAHQKDFPELEKLNFISIPGALLSSFLTSF